MKNRNLFNNIFTGIIMLSLVLFLISYFSVIGDENIEGWIQKITLPLALVSAICMEIVLPFLDNRDLFRYDKKMRILLIVKIILVALAIVPLVLNVSGALAQNNSAEFGVLAAFVVLYMAQFFINLDPKVEDDDGDYEDETEEGDDDEYDDEDADDGDDAADDDEEDDDE